MALDKCVLIHIRYAKTGNTWLQHNRTNNPYAGFMEIADRSVIVSKLIQPTVLEYQIEPFKEHIALRLQECINPISGGKLTKNVPLEIIRPSKSLMMMNVEHWINYFLYRNNMNLAAPFHFACFKKSMFLVDRVLLQWLKRIVNDKAAKYIAEMVAGRYVESNRNLSEFTQKDLASYG